MPLGRELVLAYIDEVVTKIFTMNLLLKPLGCSVCIIEQGCAIIQPRFTSLKFLLPSSFTAMTFLYDALMMIFGWPLVNETLIVGTTCGLLSTVSLVDVSRPALVGPNIPCFLLWRHCMTVWSYLYYLSVLSWK